MLFDWHQLIVILLIFKLNVVNSNGKFYTTDANKQYYLNGEQKYTWFDGLSECLKVNMSLVTIDTAVKSEEVNKVVKELFGKVVILWIGGIMTHDADARRYIWIATGREFSYTYWHGRNPDYYGNSEYCIQIGWGSDMEWNDNRCSSKYGFMCEHKTELSVMQRVKVREGDKVVTAAELQEQQREQINKLLLIAKPDFVEEIQQKVKHENGLAGNAENKRESSKYRDIIFQFNQNKYFLSNAQQTIDENR